MMNKNPIEREFIAKARSLADAAQSAEESIINRITYIVNIMVGAWGNKLDTWYFDDAEEGEVGSFWRNYSEDEITPIIQIHGSQGDTEMPFFDKRGDEWALRYSFPARWLFEEFEQELLDGKKKWMTLKQEKQEKKKNLSKKKKELIEKAKSKLTKSELAALKGVL